MPYKKKKENYAELAPWERYAYDVTHNKILANRWIKLSVRHWNEIMANQRKKDYPWYFDEMEVKKLLKFASLLQHFEGEYAGKPILLEDWQAYILAHLYGVKRKDTKKRRYTSTFVFVGRKNGKTSLGAVLMLYHLFAESGAGVYSVATKRDQAKIAFEKVEQFVKNNKAIRELVRIHYQTITYERQGSKIEALSSEHDTLDGLNPSFVLADEISQYKNSKIIDVMRTGMYSRSEPILFQITTGSENMSSVGFQEYERSQKVLQGIVQDDAFLPILYTLDEKDNWKDSSKYIKANPNLDISVSLAMLEAACEEALIAPYKEAAFKTKNLNLFENVTQSWISDKKALRAIELYRQHSVDEFDLTSTVATAAVDLSKRFDFTSYTICWYVDDIEKYVMQHRLYIPEAQIEEKLKKDSQMIRKWISEGWITATPGEVIDYSYLIRDIQTDLERYNIREIAYDPALSGTFVHLCDEHIPDADIVAVPQNNTTMSPFNVAYEEDVVGEKVLDHNPVWRWMLSNTTIRIGPTGMIYIEKVEDRKTSRRIDAVVTSVISHGRLQALLRDSAKEIPYIPLDQYVY